MLNDLLITPFFDLPLTGATILLSAVSKPFAMAFHICNYLILKMSVLNKIHSKNSSNNFYQMGSICMPPTTHVIYICDMR